MPATLLAVLLLVATPGSTARAQVTVHSTDGYDVHISTTPTGILPGSMNCPYGYSFQVELTYEVTFTGPGAPASMYTLQGSVGCSPASPTFDLPNTPSGGKVNSVGAWRDASDCTTATVGSLGCDKVFVDIEGPGITMRTVQVPFSPLPITLVEFGATANAGTVLLEWATASEKDNAFFTVERSADAETFEAVLQLPGAGNSSAILHYSAIDRDPLPGLSYYRLRQTDLNGTTTVSDMAVVEHRASGTFAVHPNPWFGGALELPRNSVGQRLEVRSAAGALRHAAPVTATSATLPELDPGAYQLVLIDPHTGARRQCRLLRL
ncbi:MAG: hypothetical protein IT230_08660 [Flavobacteriales bacterium]|nr:hypothetical protein [Flavobacteriales bacterium]